MIYDINSRCPLKVGYKTDHNANVVQLKGFEKLAEDSTVYICIDSPIEISIPLTDNMEFEVQQNITSKYCFTKAKVVEVKSDGSLIRNSKLFDFVVDASIPMFEEHEVTDPSLNLLYAQMHEKYLEIVRAFETGQLNGKDGKEGADGFSPTVEITKEEGVTEVKITTKDGEQSFEVEDGKDGNDGVSVHQLYPYFGLSTSPNVKPTTWLTTPPTMTSINKYLWCRMRVQYSDNGILSNEYLDPVIIGAYGNTGQAISVTSFLTEYQLTTNISIPPSTGWTAQPQIPSPARPYLWVRYTTTFSNGTRAVSPPTIIGNYARNGTNGKDYVLTEADKQEIADMIPVSEFTYAPVHTEYIGGAYVIKDTDGVVQTYESLKALFEDEHKFLYCTHSNVIHIPSFDEAEGAFSFSGTYTIADRSHISRVIINTANVVHVNDTHVEDVANKVTSTRMSDDTKHSTEKYPSMAVMESEINKNKYNDNEIREELADKITKPEEAPTVGKILKVKSVNEDGTFLCEWADDASGAVDDVQIDGTSILDENKVAKIALASGLEMSNIGGLRVSQASTPQINARTAVRSPINPSNLDYAVKSAMCDGNGAEWTPEEQVSARARMGIDKEWNVLLDYTFEEELPEIYFTSTGNYSEVYVEASFVPNVASDTGGTICMYNLTEGNAKSILCVSDLLANANRVSRIFSNFNGIVWEDRYFVTSSNLYYARGNNFSTLTSSKRAIQLGDNFHLRHLNGKMIGVGSTIKIYAR